MTSDFDSEYVNATREAEAGYSVCRVCKSRAKLSEHITVLFGGGLLYSVCLECVNRGESILIQKTERGISVLRRKTESNLIVAATTRDLDALKKRIA